MTEAIRVEHISKTFNGEIRALDDVSFAVEAGTVFGLLGPNGSGKTTIVRILTTILQPDSGSTHLLGFDVMSYPEHVRTLFGLAGQYAAVDENLTGRENLMMVGRLSHLGRRRSAARTGELLEQFQLTDARDRTLKTYSGGMRRRLDVAAALVARPKVLFLDEPTTGLDPQSRNALWEVIEELVGGGTTVLLTTQYLEEADRLAQQIAVIDRGHVIAEGTPRELKSAMGATVLDFGVNDHETAVQAANVLAPLSTHEPHVVANNVELTVDNGARVAIDALRILDEAKIVPSTFTIREPSLDDVFLALTGRQTETVSEALEPSTQKRKRRRQR
ncbi:MAG TPA: ATP-binding cassette domain-containing protein [Acidimicrobiales bacterium]|nr:ATP-binding cassette domain-containing protein [Acidimicrobiales bacterium]